MSTNQALLSLLGIFAIAGVGVFVLFWLERRLRRPGLGFAVLGVFLIGWGVLRLFSGERLLPVLFILQGIGFVGPLRRVRIQASAERPTQQA